MNRIKKLAVSFFIVMLAASCSGGDDASPASKPGTTAKSPGNAPAQMDSTARDSQQKTRYALAEEPFAAGGANNLEDESEVPEPGDEADSDTSDHYAEDGQVPANTIRLRERSEGYVEWQPPAELAYSKAEVVVIGPDGKRQNHSFGPGEAMSLNDSLPDGLYKWESVVTPEIDPYVRDQMRSVRESGDFQAQQQLLERLRAQGSIPTEAQANENRQAGAFVVRDGIATPTTTEVGQKGDSD
ncbi:MAG: hypothetical protein KJP04_07425 [Arenicella sp.]|nr:hypothetical protein [Arenicella sp.]